MKAIQLETYKEFIFELNQIPPTMVGKSYLQDLVSMVGQNLNVPFVEIAHLVNPKELLTVAVHDEWDCFQESHYYNLNESPWEEVVITKNYLLINNDGPDKFPENFWALNDNIKSAVSIPLFNEHNRVIGMLNVMDSIFWGDWSEMQIILEMLAKRVAVELMRMMEEEELEDLHIRAESFINARTEQLEELLNMNKKLLSTVVHDISNPISKADMFLEEYIDFEKVNFDVVRKAIDELIAITTHVKRSIVSMEKDGVPFIDTTSVSMKDLFEHSEFVFSERLSKKDLELVLVSGSHEEFDVDPVVFKNSIFNNFISNAIKFSEPGSRIEIFVEQINGDRFICIRNFGVGISAKVRESLKNRVPVESTPGTHNEMGTGLGLFTAKSYIEELGGEVRVLHNIEDLGLEVDGTTVQISVI